MNFDEIEKRLRTSPPPRPPAGLKQKLTAQIQLGRATVEETQVLANGSVIGWLRRWWPALAPAGVSLACALVMVSQRMEALELQRGNRAWEQQLTDTRAGATTRAADQTANDPAATAIGGEQEQLTRLRERVTQLTDSVTRLTRLQTENETLRKQAITPAGMNAEALDALAKARERAMAVNCVNNLKQIGLAARVWAQDSNDLYPPNFLSMSNELNTAKILLCPADTNRVAATGFFDYTDANCSYELLAPSGSDLEPWRVLTRCPIHGHIGLCDGSVQMGVAKNHPEWLIERDGKLYLHSN